MPEAVKPLDHLTYMTPHTRARQQGPGRQECRVGNILDASPVTFSLPKMLQMKDGSQANGSRQLHLVRRLCCQGHDKSCKV